MFPLAHLLHEFFSEHMLCKQRPIQLEDFLEFMKNRCDQMAKSIAKAYRAESVFLVKSSCPPLKNHEKCSEFAYNLICGIEGVKDIYSEKMNKEKGKRSLGGSEDFAYISNEVPSLMMGVAAGEIDKGYIHPLHHPNVKFDLEALPICAAVYASLALK